MIDIVFAIMIIIAIVKGLHKGVVVAVFSIIAFIIGLVAALKLSSVVALYLEGNVSVEGKWLPVISFALVFFIVVVLVNSGGKIIEKSLEMVFLGWANRLAGAVLYAALYIIIFSVILFYAEKTHLLKAETFSASATWPFIKPWGPVVVGWPGKIIPVFKDMFAILEDFFENIAGEIQP